MSDKHSEYDYFDNKNPNKTYSSPRIESDEFSQSGLPPTPAYRIVSRVFDDQEQNELAKVKGELVLYTSSGERIEVIARVYETSRKVFGVTFQRFERRTGIPHKDRRQVTVSVKSLREVIKMLQALELIPLENAGKIQFRNDDLERLLLDENEQRKFLINNPDLVRKVVENDLTELDIVGLAYRKEQLEIFEQLLTNPPYFLEKKSDWGKNRTEDVWQQFFEKNTWIFGYGLSYLFNQPFNEDRLEQLVVGANGLGGIGKRTDALMETTGAIKAVCFVEIKRHDTPLIGSTPYRSGSWPISEEVSGGISQIQSTVQLSIESYRAFIEKRRDGFLTDDKVFLYRPRSYLVVGQLQEFLDNTGNPNLDKFRSFELFRREITNPEIITFDELYSRAKFIVANHPDMSDQEPPTREIDLDF